MPDNPTETIPYDPPPRYLRGKAIWSNRYDGRPTRDFLDSLCPDDRKCVEDLLWIKM